MDVLVLSNTFAPLRRVSWQTAFTWLFSGRVEVIDHYVDRSVRSARASWPMPSIVRFLRKAAKVFRQGVKFNRRNLYLRDKGRCAYCGTKTAMHDFTFDHVTPRSRGGRTTWENIVVSCLPCNQWKGDRTPAEARMHMRYKPVRPKALPGVYDTQLVWQEGMPRSWRDYLGSVRYWHGSLDESGP